MNNGFSRWFRPSTPGRLLATFFRALVYAAIIWAVTLYVIPLQICRLEEWMELPKIAFPGRVTFGWILFCGGSLIGLSAMTTMAVHGRGTPLPTDCAPKLVVRGVYQWVRNPMAVGGLAQGFAVGTILGSPLTMVYSFAGLVLWNFWVRPIEEADLHARFGESYEAYCEDVKCWIPTRPR